MPVAAFDINVTLPPAQNVVGPPAVTTGLFGVGLLTTCAADGLDVQPALVAVTV